MLCWYCRRVKGKRSCPAHGGNGICSRCCGTKRRVEIACPEDCPYLHGEHDPRWEAPARQAEENRFIGYFAGLSPDEVPLLVFLHHLLLEARREAGGLSDRETHEIVSTLSRTFETLSKGVLYQHPSESLRLQGILGRMGNALSHRREIPSAPPASDAEVASLLRKIAAAVDAREKESPGSGTYLDAAEKVFRAAIEQAPPLELSGEGGPGGLIIEP